MQNFKTIRLNRQTKISPATLIFCEGDCNYTKLYFTDCKMVTVPITLKKVLLEIADSKFVRINKKYFINLKYLKNHDGEYITMYNDIFLKIARRRQSFFKSAINASHLKF